MLRQLATQLSLALCVNQFEASIYSHCSFSFNHIHGYVFGCSDWFYWISLFRLAHIADDSWCSISGDLHRYYCLGAPCAFCPKKIIASEFSLVFSGGRNTEFYIYLRIQAIWSRFKYRSITASIVL